MWGTRGYMPFLRALVWKLMQLHDWSSNSIFVTVQDISNTIGGTPLIVQGWHKYIQNVPKEVFTPINLRKIAFEKFNMIVVY